MYILTAILSVLALAEGVIIVCLYFGKKRAKEQHKKAVDALTRRTEKVEREWNNFLTYNGDSQE